MILPVVVERIVVRYVSKFPVPQMAGAGPADDAFEDLCRTWTYRCAQQIRHDTGDGVWGTKRADPSRPISKDSIANAGGLHTGVLLGFDLLSGVGTGHPTLIAHPESLDLTNPPDGPQLFVEVPAFDWLGDTPQPPLPPDPPPPPTPPDLLERVRALEAALAAVTERLGHTEQIANLAFVEAANAPHHGDPVQVSGKVSWQDAVYGRLITWGGKILLVLLLALPAAAQSHPCDAVIPGNPSVTAPLGVAWCWDGKDQSGAPTAITEWIVKVADVVVFRGALTPIGPPSATGLSYYETPKNLLIAKGPNIVTVYAVNDAGKGTDAVFPFVVVDSPPSAVVGLRIIKS